MSKAVLISIRPKWCELIANREKTIEVRKTRPKLETPFKCFIYCTQGSEKLNVCNIIRTLYKANGSAIGEFVCDQIFDIEYEKDEGYSENYTPLGFSDCLDDETFDRYLGGKTGYGWHISNLIIYDVPKKLSEFKRHDPTYDFSIFGEVSRTYSITRPPQSWCYVEELP